MMSFCLQELPDMTLVLRMINVLIKTIFKIKLVYRRLRYYTFCTRCRNVTDNMKYLKSLNTKIFSANMNFYKEIFSCSVTKFIWAWLNIIFPLLKTEWIFVHDITKMLVQWNKNVWFMGLINVSNPMGPEWASLFSFFLVFIIRQGEPSIEILKCVDFLK